MASRINNMRNGKKEEESLTSCVLQYLHDLIFMLAIIMVVFVLFFRMVVVSGPSMYSTL